MGWNTENGATLQELSNKSHHKYSRGYYYWKLRKREVKNKNYFRNYFSRLARALSTIRAGTARVVEEMFTRKLIKELGMSENSGTYFERTVLTDASIFTKYYLNMLLYYILYTFKIYFFTKLIRALIQRMSTKWFYYLGSYIKLKQKLWLETPGALLGVTTPKVADCRCHTSKNLNSRNHVPQKAFEELCRTNHYNWWLDCNRFENIPTYLEELF